MLIDSENLIARIDKCYQESAKTGLWLEPVMAILDIKALISVMPTVYAVPVKHGRWIHCKGESSIWYCSVCGEKIIYNPTRKTYKPDKKPVWEINKYCRNCGALMKAGGEDEST
jgi:hypothetical protein